MIRPTVGRVVLFYPAENDYRAGQGRSLAALVAAVNVDETVNLAVFDGTGAAHARQNVPLVQDDDSPDQGCWCEWMPYQKGQAAKTEDVGAKLAARLDNLFERIEAQAAQVEAVQLRLDAALTLPAEESPPCPQNPPPSAAGHLP